MTNAEARFNKIHIRKVYACLAVTCHLHLWQNDRDFLRATVVTRGWNGYRNKSQHRKSTLEKKILPPFQQGFEPATFQSRVRCSNHWAIPAPPGYASRQNKINTSTRLKQAQQWSAYSSDTATRRTLIPEAGAEKVSHILFILVWSRHRVNTMTDAEKVCHNYASVRRVRAR